MQASRPNYEIGIVAPASLGAALEDLDPDLAIAGEQDTFAPEQRPARVDYRPYEDPVARVCVGGRTRKIADLELADLIAAPNRTTRGC